MLLAIILTALAGTTFGGGDVLCLKDGRVFDNVDLDRTEAGIVLHYEHGDVTVPHEMVRFSHEAGGAGFVPQTDEEREKYAEGLVPFDGKWIKEKKWAKLVEKRRKTAAAELKDYRAHREWANRYIEKNKNISYEYTVPKPIFDDYRLRLEAYFKVFAKQWKTKKSKTPISICFYGTRKEFDRTSGLGGGVLGYFKFIGDYDLNIYYDRLDPAQTEDVMFHEVGHYLIKLIDEDFSFPHFPGESLCEYYGASDWDPVKKKLTTGLIQDGRLAGIKTEIAGGEYLGLEKMITTREMFAHYSWGWSLVHFLMNDKRYAKKFAGFGVGLARDKGVKRTQGSFGLKTVEPDEVFRYFRSELGLKTATDVLELEREWHAYIDALEPGSADGLADAAMLAKRTLRPIKAERLFREALEAGCENPVALRAFAGLLASKGKREEAKKMLERAIAKAPLAGRYYYELAQVCGDKDEEKRLEGLAADIDPDADFGSIFGSSD